MGALIGLVAILPLIFVCKKLSRFFFRAADYFDEKNRRKAYYEKCMLESLEDIQGSLVQPDKKPMDYTERLLRANQDIMEKNSLSEAMKNELGIM